MNIIKCILYVNSVLISFLSVPFILSHHIIIAKATLKIVFYSELAFIICSFTLLWVSSILSNLYIISPNVTTYDLFYKICDVLIKAIGIVYIVWYFIITDGVDKDSIMFREILNIYLLPICANGILILTKKL